MIVLILASSPYPCSLGDMGNVGVEMVVVRGKTCNVGRDQHADRRSDSQKMITSNTELL